MNDLVLVGAGEMGRAALSILAGRLPEARFAVLDRDAGSLSRAAEIAPGRVETLEADVHADPPDLAGARLVLNFAGPFYLGLDSVARAAVAAGSGYVDICDDVAGIGPVLALDEAARETGATLITGSGNSPGTSNMMAKRLLELNPDCDGIRILWAGHESEPGGLAPLRHMLYMAVAPCPVWRDGEFVDEPGFVPSTAKTFEVPELGEVEFYNTAHSEPVTLARAFPELRYIGVMGALLPAWSSEVFSSLGRLGFGYDDLEIEIDGRPVDAVEVLWKVLWERHERHHAGEPRTGIGVIQAQALQGEEVVATMTQVDPNEMANCTAIGAVAAGLALLEGDHEAGASGPEILDAERTLALVEELGEAIGSIPGGLRLDLAPTSAGPA